MCSFPVYFKVSSCFKVSSFNTQSLSNDPVSNEHSLLLITLLNTALLLITNADINQRFTYLQTKIPPVPT